MRGATIAGRPASSGPDAADPQPPHDDGGGGRWAWLVTTRDVYEAELLRGSLESSGVPVALHGRDCSPFAWMYPAGNMNVPVQVFVPATLLEAARLHVLESSFASPPAGATPPAEGRSPSRFWLAVAVASAVVVFAIVMVEILGLSPCGKVERDGRLVPLCSVR